MNTEDIVHWLYELADQYHRMISVWEGYQTLCDKSLQYIFHLICLLTEDV